MEFCESINRGLITALDLRTADSWRKARCSISENDLFKGWKFGTDAETAINNKYINSSILKGLSVSGETAISYYASLAAR
jgi:hypothetical protein